MGKNNEIEGDDDFYPVRLLFFLILFKTIIFWK